MFFAMLHASRPLRLSGHAPSAVLDEEVSGTERSWAGCMSSYSSQTQRFPELRFSVTLGQKPEIEVGLV